MSNLPIITRIIFPSIVRNVPADLEYSLGFGIAQIGDLIAVELSEPSFPADIELPNGRIRHFYPEELLIGAVGFREAPKSYVGIVPTQGILIHPNIENSQNLALLSAAGLIGVLISRSPYIQDPPRVRPRGLLQKGGKNINLRHFSCPWRDSVSGIPPLVIFVGTSSESGKTTAAAVVIRHLTLRGMKVAAAKLTGAGRIRDLLAFRDAGAIAAYDFVDAGLPSTPDEETALPAAKGILAKIISESEPDVIIVELAGSLLVKANRAILRDPEIRNSIAGIVLAASDEVGAVGGVHLLSQEWGLVPIAITGPVSDNQAGVTYVKEAVHIPAINWRDAEQLINLIEKSLSSFRNKKENNTHVLK